MQVHQNRGNNQVTDYLVQLATTGSADDEHILPGSEGILIGRHRALLIIVVGDEEEKYVSMYRQVIKSSY